MSTNQGWKDDESELMVIKAGPIKRVIGRS